MSMENLYLLFFFFVLYYRRTLFGRKRISVTYFILYFHNEMESADLCGGNFQESMAEVCLRKNRSLLSPQ